MCKGQATGLLLCVKDKQHVYCCVKRTSNMFIVVCDGQATGLLLCVMDKQQVYCCV